MNKRDFIKSAMFIPALYMSYSHAKDDGVKKSCLVDIDKSKKELNVHQWDYLVVDDDWTPAFDAANEYAKKIGGAKIRIPGGKYNVCLTLSSHVYWVGDGQGLTILSQAKGQNRDIVITENFLQLSGKGPLNVAPISFGLTNLTIDGNYLADYESTILDGDTSINNDKGYGIKIFGSKYLIDVEIVNCPEIGFYSEAVDYHNYAYEQDSRIRITGRVFGKEGVIFRGPADINIEHIMIGCVGWLAKQSERESELVMSDLYLGEPVHVMVSDETKFSDKQFNGHHEFTFLHLYGNRHGYGYKAFNTSRIKGTHMICENCRGGAYFGERVWGAVLLLECHNNSRLSSQSSDSFPDVMVLSKQSFQLNVIIRRVITESEKYIGVHSKAEMLNLKLSYFSVKPFSKNSVVAVLDSKNSNHEIMLRDVLNTAIFLRGYNNNTKINGSNVLKGSLLEVDVKGNKGVNKIDIMADNCDQVIVVKNEQAKIDLNINASLKDGQKLFGIDSIYKGEYTSKVSKEKNI